MIQHHDCGDEAQESTGGPVARPGPSCAATANPGDHRDALIRRLGAELRLAGIARSEAERRAEREHARCTAIADAAWALIDAVERHELVFEMPSPSPGGALGQVDSRILEGAFGIYCDLRERLAALGRPASGEGGRA